MKIKKYNWFLKLFLRKSIIAITLCPFGIFVKNIDVVKKRTINHEKIHWKQQLEMFIIFFYIWYFIEWFIRLFINSNAYRSISFEQEAYNYDDYDNYLEYRKKYNWIKYITKKVNN